MTTPRFSLPELAVAQALKEITHNEALAIVDVLLGGTVGSVLATPPGSPTNGQVVLVAHSGTTGVFVGKEDKIAFWLTSVAAWQYITPTTGQKVTDGATSTTYRWNGTLWLALSGTYTPTLTNVTNVSASTAYPCQWMRVGNVVTVSGRVRITATGVGAAELGISLPVASNFANEYEAAGTGTSDTVADGPMWLEADVTNDRLALKSTQSGTTYHQHFFHTTYLVI